ncbi:hypothetical protein RUM44_001353 [Polyplax serrata]|uniref:Uncharacterized protein n=1 Tax=Polyplax serrata TaxID=468196 RepID=A0ABR1AJU2_POLSC
MGNITVGSYPSHYPDDCSRMARLDSGNETLLSDESPCELSATPPESNDAESSAGDSEKAKKTNSGIEENLVPPKITPFSGVLDKKIDRDPDNKEPAAWVFNVPAHDPSVLKQTNYILIEQHDQYRVLPTENPNPTMVPADI